MNSSQSTVWTRKESVVTLYPPSALTETSKSQNALKVDSCSTTFFYVKENDQMKHAGYKSLTCSNLSLYLSFFLANVSILEPSLQTYNLYYSSLPSEITQCWNSSRQPGRGRVKCVLLSCMSELTHLLTVSTLLPLNRCVFTNNCASIKTSMCTLSVILLGSVNNYKSNFVRPLIRNKEHWAQRANWKHTETLKKYKERWTLKKRCKKIQKKSALTEQPLSK